MDVVIKAAILFAIMCGLYKLLSIMTKKVSVEIDCGMRAGNPELYCSISNNVTHAITLNECHLIVDGHHSPLPFIPIMSLPRIIQYREGAVFCFDPAPLLIEATEMGQNDFQVRAFFQDSVDRTYLSKTITIDTDPSRFIRIFEDVQEHGSASVEKVSHLAQEIAEQLDQQLVGIPHIVLALVQEQNGVGGYILREFGLQEDFLLNLARSSPNLPRDHKWPHPHWSIETQELVYEFMAGEARKMRQRCQGTGHLLLGLTSQKNKAFLDILEHLEVQPRQLRGRVYEVLRKDQNRTDHPTLPPEGIKRYVWSVWYVFAHTLLKIGAYVFMWLFPDAEF